MNATDTLLKALRDKGMKTKGDGADRWRSQCPAHGGTDMNLAVAAGDQGVLVKCWSHDCTEGDIASSLGLKVTDLFDESGQAVYDYGGGHNVYRTRTGTGKKIRQENSPAVTTLYAPPGSAPVSTSATVFMAEGEKTADALIRLGVPCAVTWPGGSSAVGKVDLTPLAGKFVFVVPDNDAPGAKATEQLIFRLKDIASETQILRIPETYDGHSINDAADLRMAGGSLSDAVAEVVSEPIDPRFESAVQEQRFADQVRSEAKKREADAKAALTSDTLTPKTLGEIIGTEPTYDWLVPGLFERRDRLIVTGSEGAGKSWLMRQLVICMAAGIHPFNMSEPIAPLRVLVIDAENTEQQWSRGARYVTGISEQYGTGKPRTNVLVSAGVRMDLTTSQDVNQVHRLIDKHKPDVLYIGPLYKLTPKAINTDDDAAPLIVALDGFRDRGLLLVMEAHAGHAKGAGGERDLRPRGSSALLGWPEFGFGLALIDGDESMATFTPWRGGREIRDWPMRLRKGLAGEMPWMPA
jgi:hypothetical protein